MKEIKIKEIFDKHYSSLGEFVEKKFIKKAKQTFNEIYNTPLPESVKIAGTILQTCNIRYGDFLEEIINLFLQENGFILKQSESSKTLNYDLFFETDNELYVGEIKIRDNHDSSKKVGQIDNLIIKTKKQKELNNKKKVISIIYFIDPSENKNSSYYRERLQSEKDNNNFDDFEIFFGDDLFEKFQLKKEWDLMKYFIKELNIKVKKNNGIYKIISNYIKDLEIDDPVIKNKLLNHFE